METMWSSFVQTSEELYQSRALRFREDNRELWLAAMGLRDGMNVLEVGCRVTGLDRDAGHIGYARAKTKELGLDCAFVQGDALALPFEDGTFDACTSHTVIEHVETAGFLGEQYRVLKPGGIISVLSVRTGLTVAPENWMPEEPEEKALFEKAWEHAKDHGKAHGIARYEMKECYFPMALEKAGFVNINVNFIAVTRYAPDNAALSRELALAQIEENRLSALESVKKALRICPDALSDEERQRLTALIHRRFDARVAKYEQGQKLWDIAASVVMAVTGNKPNEKMMEG